MEARMGAEELGWKAAVSSVKFNSASRCSANSAKALSLSCEGGCTLDRIQNHGVRPMEVTLRLTASKGIYHCPFAALFLRYSATC